MGIFDKVKSAVKKNEQKIDGGIDKAADLAEDKLGDKVGRDKIAKAEQQAHQAVDKLSGD